MADMDLVRRLWAAAAEDAKKAAVAPAFYRAIEKVVPVAWEDGVFVIGLASDADGTLQSALKAGENQLKIEAALRVVSADAALKLRLIEGTTAADWAAAKARDAAERAEVARLAERKTVATAAPSANWDGVMDQVMKLWADTESRNMAVGKARFLSAALNLVDQAMDTVGAADDRALTRVLERIGSSTGSDPAVLALLLLERRRAAGK